MDFHRPIRFPSNGLFTFTLQIFCLFPRLMRREYDGIMMENLKHPVETCRNWVSPWPFFTNHSKGSSGNDSPCFHGLPDPSPCYPSFACSLSPGCPCSSPTPKQLEGNGSQRIWIMDGPSHLQDILVEIFDAVACFNLSWKTLVTSGIPNSIETISNLKNLLAKHNCGACSRIFIPSPSSPRAPEHAACLFTE